LLIFSNQRKEFYLATVSDLRNFIPYITYHLYLCGLVFYPEDGGSRFL
jgi:hypothetical protein